MPAAENPFLDSESRAPSPIVDEVQALRAKVAQVKQQAEQEKLKREKAELEAELAALTASGPSAPRSKSALAPAPTDFDDEEDAASVSSSVAGGYETIEPRKVGAAAPSIKHGSQAEAQNCLYLLEEYLSTLNLTDAAEHGPLEGAPPTDTRGHVAMRDLNTAITAFVQSDGEVVGSLREDCPRANGYERLQYIREHYLKPMDADHSKAEAAIATFDFKLFDRADDKAAREHLRKFRRHVKSLAPGRQGDDAMWIDYIWSALSEKTRSAVQFEMAKGKYPLGLVNMGSFVQVVGKAVDAERTRELKKTHATALAFSTEQATAKDEAAKRAAEEVSRPSLDAPGAFARPPLSSVNAASKEKQKCNECGEDGHAFFDCPKLNPCPSCKGRTCPKGSDSDKPCDVYETPEVRRVSKMSEANMTRINKLRVAAGQPKLVRPQVCALSTESPMDMCALSTEAPIDVSVYDDPGAWMERAMALIDAQQEQLA